MNSASIDNFRDSMRGAGIVTDEQIIADGTLHCFHIDGDKSGSRKGWYVAHFSGVPAGAFGSWKTGHTETWCAKARASMSASEKQAYRAFISKARSERDQARADAQREAKARAAKIWGNARPAPEDHLYLKAKGVKPHGARVHEGNLVIPVRDGHGNLQSLQFIAGNGNKQCLKGGAIRGHYHVIGGQVLNVIYTCEGFSTAATIHAATGQLVVVAFNAGNLESVAMCIKQKYPGVELVIAADNDTETEGNPGVRYAAKAAQAVGAMPIIPTFPAGRSGTDFNDLMRAASLDEVRKQLETPLEAKSRFEAPPPQDEPPNKSAQLAKIAQLAALDLIEYDQQRKAAAKELGCRETTLDKLVAAKRAEQQAEARFAAIDPGDVQPWHEPVDGVDLLNELSDTLVRFAVLP